MGYRVLVHLGGFRRAGYLGTLLPLAGDVQHRSASSVLLDLMGGLNRGQRAWQLHDWIVAHADFEPLERLPAFLFVGVSELNYLALNDTEQGYSGETRSIEGVYAPSIIFLGTDIRVGRDDDVLLHELVHHFQELAGTTFERPRR